MAVTMSLYDHTAKLFANKEVNFTRLQAKLLDNTASFTAANTAVNSVDGGATPATVTVTIATPGVFTDTAHGFSANHPVKYETTGALPTGLTAGTYYYVVGASITTNTYQVSATPGGAAINTTGSQSGVHTRYDTGAKEVNGNAWPVGGPVLGSVAVTQVTTNDAQISASNVVVTASGGTIGPAYAALVYDASTMKPLIYIDFGQAQSAGDTTDFKIVWDATNGIIKWSY